MLKVLVLSDSEDYRGQRRLVEEAELVVRTATVGFVVLKERTGRFNNGQHVSYADFVSYVHEQARQ